MKMLQNAYYYGGKVYTDAKSLKEATGMEAEGAEKNTLSYGILAGHNSGTAEKLSLRFDALASHDITYVGIIQTALASGLRRFPVPYILTNCHNSLCAVGGTINEDDHVFGLSAAKKYGGIYVPAHMAVIHQYMRERHASPGKMILGSDSHTRYGALGCLGIGEGGPEIVKQLLCRSYDVPAPGVVCVHLTGAPPHGVGPQDVALTLIKEVYNRGTVKNKIVEFVGSGIGNLSVDFRNSVDVMTTETACLSSVWETDEAVRSFLALHGRADEYAELKVKKPAFYDTVIELDLSRTEPMAALPFHPSNVCSVKELQKNAGDMLRETERSAERLFGAGVKLKLTDKLVGGRICAGQGVIAGCAGGIYENIAAAAAILKGGSVGSGAFSLSVYPASQPVYLATAENGLLRTLAECGAVVKTPFCGPCFGAGDVPANGALSLRHTTRNFPNREGSKPAEGQAAAVVLMDARSVAASAKNGGVLTSAADVDYDETVPPYFYDGETYKSRVYCGFGKAKPDERLVLGPNIAPWPGFSPLCCDVLYKVAAYITDPVTTTDELIPSGETSSYRSNPERLSQFALSRKVPEYVGRAKLVREAERLRLSGGDPAEVLPELAGVYAALKAAGAEADAENTGIYSLIYANKPGDGSAREQAASCQRVLGGGANIAAEYATKRYRSNLINWGLVPFLTERSGDFACGDYIYVKGLRKAIKSAEKRIDACVVRAGAVRKTTLLLPELNEEERRTILAGCLINHYKTCGN